MSISDFQDANSRVSMWTACCLMAALVVSGQAQQPSAYKQKTRTFHSAADFDRLTGGKVSIERHLDPRQDAALRQTSTPLPATQFTVIAAESPSVMWIGTRQGAIRWNRERSVLEYFAGQRWLPDDEVTGIGFEGGAAWIETARGFARIEYQAMTLADKSRLFVDRVQARHNRWGLTADSQLRVPGDLSTNQMASSDNDGLWTAMHVAAECFRYKVTGAADARDNARRGMQAIVRLEAITGIPGFPARSFIGHYFVYPIYHDLVANDSEKPRLRAVVERITNHILDNKYQLVDVDGKRTRWGWWGPEAIWEDPDETGLRALHILAHLRVARHLTANARFRARYQAAYDDLIKTHKYHLLTRNQKIMVPGSINHSDDELAFLSYYPLLQYERDAALLEVYRHSLTRSWLIERPERNPLWNVIYAAGTGAKEYDRSESIRTLQEIPMDQIQWTVRNSYRLDVPIDGLRDRQGRRQALIVLPYDELPMSKWNGNPFNLDGGSGGRSEDDGAYFLLPYWMGRYHQLLDE